MNLVKLIPYNLRERIRKMLFGKNHFHDLSEFAVQIGCHVAFDVGTQYGYEAILFAKAGMEVFAFDSNALSCQYAAKNAHNEDVAYDVMRLIERLAARPFWRQNFIRVGYVRVIRSLVTDVDNGKSSITLRSFSVLAGKYPDFLKIDTDTDDLKVLDGYPFDKHRPMLLSVEYDATGAVDRKLLAEGYLLIYAIYKPQTRARRAIFSRYSLSPEFYGGEWGDVIAVLPQHYVALRDKLFGF